MNVEKKIMLLAAALVLILLVSVPSVLFQDAFKKYFSFLYSWDVAVKPVNSVTISAPPRDYVSKLPQPELRFVEFSLKMPKARSVKLAGDFNKWNADKLPLSKNGSRWKTILTLPVGSYKYLYKIDGKFVLDPLNPKTTYHNSRKVSLLIVK
mgnify:CR=1 FL=1